MLNHTSSKYLLTIALLIILLYGTFVFRHVFHTPEIYVDQGFFIETDQSILTLSGEVKHMNTLMINSKPLLFEQTGRFEQTRTLEDGISKIILHGSDKFGREIEAVVTVHKDPSPFNSPLTPETPQEDLPEA